MPGKSRKQLKNNKSKKTRGGRKQRKTKRGGIVGIPSLGVFKPTGQTSQQTRNDQNAAYEADRKAKADALSAAGIDPAKIPALQGILQKTSSFGGQEIRALLRNGDRDAGKAAADEVYKSKIRTLVAIYGKRNQALYQELQGVLHEV